MNNNLTPEEKLRSNRRYLDKVFTKTVRMTYSEKEAIQEAANRMDMSMNKFIIEAALTYSDILS